METCSLLMERTIKASQEKVFDFWTTADALRQWHCGTILDVKMDLEVGGDFMIEFAPEEHCDHQCVRGKYQTVDRPRKLEYTWKWDGNESEDSLVTVEFIEKSANETLLKVTHIRLENSQSRDNHQMGWEKCLDGFQTLVESKAQVSAG